MYLLLPVLQMYLTSRPHFRPLCMWLGLGITASGLVGAAFANTTQLLVLTQGVMYGIGGSESRVDQLTSHALRSDDRVSL